VSVETAAALPFPTQRRSFPIPSGFPQRRRAAAGPIPSAHGGRGGGAGGGGGGLSVGGGGEEVADWGGWPHKESWARASATGNGHRDQPRMHTGLARCPRAQRGNGARFLGWVAAAAAVPFVVPTRPPSHGSIAAPIPRFPASGDARRRGFGLSACWRRGARGAPTAAAGTHACHRSRNSTHSAPPLRLDREAPLSTFAVPAGPQRSSFVSATCGGAGGCSRGRSGGVGGAHSRSPCGCLRRVAARSPRVLWRPMEHFRCAIPRRPPPLPPHSGHAECDAKVARPPRPPLPFQSDTPHATCTAYHKHTRKHRRNTCTIHLNTCQHARVCIADGAQSSFGTAPLWLRRDKTLCFGPETAPNIHFSRRLQGQGGKL
jgi:hypothetical protein